MRDVLTLSRIVQGKNPREYFDPQEMAELEEGIRAYGVLQAILVRPIKGSNLFEIIAGERRWRAAKNAFGDDYDMPVVILDVGDIDADAIALIENYHRADVSVAEEAKGAQRQLYRNNGDKNETARQLGWNPSLLERRLALLVCTPAVLKALTERRILTGHAELLAGVPAATQDKVLDGVIAHKVPVSVLKKQLGQFARRLAEAIFDTGQCKDCVHNSARQTELFAESLGDGYCQHPTHFDELTMQAIDSKAAALKDEYQVIKIIKASDGFTPLHLRAEGELGVGTAQYVACKGCQSFGCTVSALPGSYGLVTESLCFDAACNTKKVVAHRKAERVAGQSTNSANGSEKSIGKDVVKLGGNPTNKLSTDKPKPSNQPSQRVLQYRVEQWRKWAANVLMMQPERNQKTLIALTLSSRTADCRSVEYGAALTKIIGENKGDTCSFKDALERSDGLSADYLPCLVQAVAASAAFGLDEANLLPLLNYLAIDETQHFQIDKNFLGLFTMNELESLAEEIGLRKAMGERFSVARAGKKDAFIAALLSVKTFAYRGTVPSVMRYPRKPFRHATKGSSASETTGMDGSEKGYAAEESGEAKLEEALAAA